MVQYMKLDSRYVTLSPSVVAVMQTCNLHNVVLGSTFTDRAWTDSEAVCWNLMPVVSNQMYSFPVWCSASCINASLWINSCSPWVNTLPCFKLVNENAFLRNFSQFLFPAVGWKTQFECEICVCSGVFQHTQLNFHQRCRFSRVFPPVLITPVF